MRDVNGKEISCEESEETKEGMKGGVKGRQEEEEVKKVKARTETRR